MSKQQCEICGQMKSQQEMSKSYKHRCKECVARRARKIRQFKKKHSVDTQQMEVICNEISLNERERNERLTIATAAMQGILTNDRLVNLVDRYNGGIENGVVKLALSITDKLLAEIDKSPAKPLCPTKKGDSND